MALVYTVEIHERKFPSCLWKHKSVQTIIWAAIKLLYLAGRVCLIPSIPIDVSAVYIGEQGTHQPKYTCHFISGKIGLATKTSKKIFPHIKNMATIELYSVSRNHPQILK